MLVDLKKMKHLRMSKNWTQQHLADVCGVSMRTIQRVEKDGVASNETVASYAAVFETDVSEFLMTVDEYRGGEAVNASNRGASNAFSNLGGFMFVGVFVAGVVAGAALVTWLV